MGGYNAGEIASWNGHYLHWHGNESLAGTGRDYAPATDVAGAGVVCGNANHAILGASLSNPQYSGMGTTLVVGVFSAIASSSAISGIHAATACAQGVAANHARPFLVAGTGRCRHIDQEQAAASSNRNLVTRALGVEPHMQNGSERISVAPSDLFVMCSDGLTDMVNDEELADLLCAPGSLEEKQGCSLTRPMPTAVVITSAYCWCRRLPEGKTQPHVPSFGLCLTDSNITNHQIRVDHHAQNDRFDRRRRHQRSATHQRAHDAGPPPVQRHRDRQPGGERRTRGHPHDA